MLCAVLLFYLYGTALQAFAEGTHWKLDRQQSTSIGPSPTSMCHMQHLQHIHILAVAPAQTNKQGIGQSHAYMHIHGVSTVLLAGIVPYVR